MQALCRPIMIRRSKTVISLPKRLNLIKTVDFSREEEWEYRKIEIAASTAHENPTRPEFGTSTIWNKLQLISKLRIFCNLGREPCLTSLIGAEPSLRLTQGVSQDPREAIISSQIALGGTCCVQCQGIIDASETPIGDNQSPLAYYSTCELVFCKSCAGLCNYETASHCKCDSRTGRCSLRTLRLEYGRGVEIMQPTLQVPKSQRHRSSKVCALVEEVMMALPEKRCVIQLNLLSSLSPFKVHDSWNLTTIALSSRSGKNP